MTNDTPDPNDWNVYTDDEQHYRTAIDDLAREMNEAFEPMARALTELARSLGDLTLDVDATAGSADEYDVLAVYREDE